MLICGWNFQPLKCNISKTLHFIKQPNYKLIFKSFPDFAEEDGLAQADQMSLEKDGAMLAPCVKSECLVQCSTEGQKSDLNDPTAQKSKSQHSVCKTTHTDAITDA